MAEDFLSDLFEKIEHEGGKNHFYDNLFHTFLSNFPDLIYFKDNKSRFVKINDSCKSLYKKDEIIGKTDFDFFPKNVAQKSFQIEQEILSSGVGKSNYIEKIRDYDGTTKWLASTKVPFTNENGEILGLFGISRDISERKKIERDLANRARELQCFIEISSLTKNETLSTEGYINKINELIPDFFSHVHICASLVLIGNKAIKSEGFRETQYYEEFNINENNIIVGHFKVYSQKNIKKGVYQIPSETLEVFKLIAERISEIVEKKWIVKKMKKWEHILNDVENHIDLFP